MKKVILLFIIYSTISFAQQSDASKVRIHKISLGIGGFYIKNDYSEGGGTAYIVDASFNYKKNLMMISFLNGSEIGIISSSTYSFREISLKYGRELPVFTWFYIEGYSGLGYYNQTSKSNDIINGNTISIPINIKFLFKINENFSIGLNNNYSINNINNNLSSNIEIGYSF